MVGAARGIYPAFCELIFGMTGASPMNSTAGSISAFSNVWRYFFPPAEKKKGLLFCQSTQSTQAKVWMLGELHLPAPVRVAYLAADPLTDNEGAPRKLLMF